MQKLAPIAAILISTFAITTTSGCASMFAGAPVSIKGYVEADTDDVTISIIDNKTGQKNVRKGRQFDFDAIHGHEYDVVADAPGYYRESRRITSGFNVATLLNIIAPPFGALWILVDLATGAIFEPTPSGLNLQMQKK